jgi:hypothetical protein
MATGRRRPARTWSLIVGDQQVRVVSCGYRGRQSAQLRAGDLRVTLIGRGVDLETVRLALVSDLRPYLDGRNEMISRHAEQRRPQPPPVLAPAGGVAAVRALVDTVLGDHVDQVSAVQAGREPRQRAGWSALWNALWQRAVAEQARLSGIGRPCGRRRSGRRCGTRS